MEMTYEQINEVKKQLINHINESFPEENKEESIQKILSMNDSELLDFLEKNGVIKENTNNNSECIFCSIFSNKIPSVKLFENKENIAILEINPLSEGHTIIIPKEHSNNIQGTTKKFAEDVKQKIMETLKPKEIILERGELFGHSIINLIPVYGKTLENERRKVSQEELNKTKEKILSEKEKEEQIENIEIRKEEPLTDIIIPKRIP